MELSSSDEESLTDIPSSHYGSSMSSYFTRSREYKSDAPGLLFQPDAIFYLQPPFFWRLMNRINWTVESRQYLLYEWRPSVFEQHSTSHPLFPRRWCGTRTQ